MTDEKDVYKEGIQNRLNELIGLAGSASNFAKSLGVSTGNVGDWISGRSLPKALAIIAMSEVYKKSTDWILKGIEPQLDELLSTSEKELLSLWGKLNTQYQEDILDYIRFKIHKNLYSKKLHYISQAAERISDYNVDKNKANVYIPILGTAAAGNPILAEEVLDGFVPMSKDIINGQAFLVRIKGDSMIEEGINDGDLALVRPQPIVDTGEIALVKYDNEVTVKKFYREDSFVRLKPANPKYQDIIIKDLQLVKVLGKVIKVITQAEADRSIKHVEDHRQ